MCSKPEPAAGPAQARLDLVQDEEGAGAVTQVTDGGPGSRREH